VAKGIGAAMLLLASLILAGSVAKKERDKLSNLLEMERALFMLSHEISFSGRNIREACEGMAYHLEGAVSRLFFEIAEDMAQDETMTFGACWCFRAQGLFPKEAEAVLKSFAATLGTLSKDLEEQSVSGARTRLTEMIPAEKEQYAKNRRLVYALCVGAGVSLVILLI